MSLKRDLVNRLKRKVYNTNVRYGDWLRNEALKDVPVSADGIRYNTNIRKRSPLLAEVCYRKDMAIEAILDKGKYTFKNTLFILNPFEMSPMTGFLVFNTDKEYKVRYTVKGIRGSADYTNCDERFTKRHCVPVYGMFAGCINRIEVCIEDNNNNVVDKTTVRILIKMSETKKNLKKGIVIENKTAEFPKEFIMATGGYSGATYAFDSKGNVRWYMTAPIHPYGLYMLSNGHFIAPDKRMRRPNYGNAHSVIAYEMDFFGRVYKSLYHPVGFHHWAIEKEDENFLIATSSLEDGYMENVIAELDKVTGKEIRKISFNDIFDNTYITRYDWAHVNAFDYIKDEDAVIVSLRNIHTIVKISLAKNQIEWIIANPEFYKDTEQEEKVLKPVGKIEWFFQQHGVKIIDIIRSDGEKKIRIAFFDNHTANRRPVDWFEDTGKSYIMIFTVDEIAGTVNMDTRIEVTQSATRSNIEYDEENNIIYAMCANIKSIEHNFRAAIQAFDLNTDRCVNSIWCLNDFFIAGSFELNMKSVINPVYPESMWAGELYKPVKTDIPNDLIDAGTVTDDLKSDIMFSVEGNILQIYAKDHDLQMVYLYNDDKGYVQNFTDTKQLTKIFKEHMYYMSVPMYDMEKGKYKAGIKYNSKYMNTDYWIEIK